MDWYTFRWWLLMAGYCVAMWVTFVGVIEWAAR